MRVLMSLIVVCSLVLCDCGCDKKPVEPKEKVNPNLKLLTRGVGFGRFEAASVSAEFPTWSPGGDRIYFMNIAGNWQDGDFHVATKQIREISLTGGESSLLFEGPYLFLALSPDGTTFATNLQNTFLPFPGGHPLLIDIATGNVDSLPIDTSLKALFLEFTPSGDSLVYYAVYKDSVNGNYMTAFYWGAFYAFDLNTRTNHQLFTEDPFLVAGLAMTTDGKIITAGKIRNLDGSDVRELTHVGIWQTLSPSGDTVVGGFGLTLLRSTYVELTHLPSDSVIQKLWLIETEQDIYVYSEFRFSPDSQTLSLCITPGLTGGSGHDYGHNAIYLLSPLD